MIDEKTSLKLKQIAKGLGSDWKVDFINANNRFITIKNGHHVELRLRKKFDTKFTYEIMLFLMETPYKYYSHQPVNHSKIMINQSTEKLVKHIKANVIPQDLAERIIEVKTHIAKRKNNQDLEKYFINTLNAFGEIAHTAYNHNSYSLDLTTDEPNRLDKKLVKITHSKKDIYNLSTELSRDNIIKVIGFIKGLIENEPCGT